MANTMEVDDQGKAGKVRYGLDCETGRIGMAQFEERSSDEERLVCIAIDAMLLARFSASRQAGDSALLIAL